MHKRHPNSDSSLTVTSVVVQVMREDTTQEHLSGAKGWEFERKLCAAAHTLYHCTPRPQALLAPLGQQPQLRTVSVSLAVFIS